MYGSPLAVGCYRFRVNAVRLTCFRPNASQMSLSQDTSNWPHLHSSGESGCVLESDCQAHAACVQLSGRTAHVPHAQGDSVEDAAGTIGSAAFDLFGEFLVKECSWKVGGRWD